MKLFSTRNSQEWEFSIAPRLLPQVCTDALAVLRRGMEFLAGSEQRSLTTEC